MALNVPADPPSGGLPAPVLEPPAQAPAPQPGRGLDKLYIAISSSQLTIALAALLAFIFAIAAILPQVPAGLDPLAAARWLATAATRYGRFGPLFSSSGLFNVLGGPWIFALLAVTTVHLSLRVANQARRLRTPFGGIPAAPQGLPFELIHLPFNVDTIHGRVTAFVSTQQPVSLVTADLSAARPRVDAYAEHRSWAAFGPLLTYLGPLLVVLGLLWNTVAGWRVPDITLIPGRTVQPAQAGGLALSLVDAGNAEDGRSGVIALARGGQTRNAWLSYGRPATWGNVWVAQRSSGPALSVRATDGGNVAPVQALEGEDAPLDSLHLRFGENESEQAFTIPALGLAFRIVSYESLVERGIDRPVFLVEGYQGSDPIPALNELVEDSKMIEWQGATLTLQREAYVVVDLAAMPGLPLLGLGAFALLAGVVLVAWAGLTRTWLNAAAEGDGALLAVRVAAPAVGQAEVSRVAANLTAPAGVEMPVLPRARPGLRYFVLILGGAALLAAFAWLALQGAGSLVAQLQTWVFALYAALAFLGLGALAAGAIQSVLFVLRGNSLSAMADPMLRGPVQGLRGRPGDPGRGVSLAAYPLLTAAICLGSIWGLLVFAAPVRLLPAEMWLLAAWLLAGAYFHATSGWRPLRIPAWLAAVLILAALAAGIAACLTAPSLLTL